MTPIVSYVIPCYNCETTIYDAVLSIKESDMVSRQGKELLWPRIEVILIDDGSTDSTPDILKALATQFSNVKIKCLGKNKGRGIARNNGNEMAKAPIIAVLDSDDWNLNDRTGEILKYFKNNPDIDVFYSSFIGKHTFNDRQLQFPALKIDRAFLKEYGLFRICHSTVAYTKKAILELPYSEDRNKDDWDMLWNFFTKEYVFGYSEKPLVVYRIDESDVAKNNEEGREERLLKKRQMKMKEYWNEKDG